MTRQTALKYLPHAIVIIAIMSVLGYPREEGNLITVIDNTTLLWIIKAAMLICFAVAVKKLAPEKDQLRSMRWIQYYLIWNLLEGIHGVFQSENYWDWKGLINNLMALMLPVVAYTSLNMEFVQRLMRSYMTYALPIGILVLFLASPDAYGFYLAPLGFLALFLPFLQFKWRVGVFLLITLVLVVDLDARSNVIKFVVPLLLLMLIPLKKLISLKLIEAARKLLLIAPLVFFILAATDVFNIFKMDEYVGGDFTGEKVLKDGEIMQTNLTADTRTFIYREVLQTAASYNTWIFGRSPARGNDTVVFADWARDITGREERLNNEVAIANIFMWTGIVGVILYGLIFFSASYLAVNKSNNIYAKMLGLFIAFRWAYAWVEDINNFSVNYFMIWVMIGVCYSPTFRSWNDTQVKYWVKGILDVKYRKKFARYNFFMRRANAPSTYKPPVSP